MKRWVASSEDALSIHIVLGDHVLDELERVLCLLHRFELRDVVVDLDLGQESVAVVIDLAKELVRLLLVRLRLLQARRRSRAHLLPGAHQPGQLRGVCLVRQSEPIPTDRSRNANGVITNIITQLYTG